tara:strand:+ start:8369 stop:9244 length:876 start_codon:yes stop_codon:yes gene_type:complete
MNDATPKTFIIEKGLTRRQKTALKKAPPQEQIRTRQDKGRTLAYLEGWYVIAEANRIFGPENWDRATLATQCVWQGKSNGNPVCAYTARVQIRIRAGLASIVREGSGVGQAVGQDPGEAHGLALKAAETDATKRCLATLGAPFGLSLYDKTHPSTIEALNSGARLPDRNCSSSAGRPDEGSNLNISETKAPWIAFGPTGDIQGVFKDPVRCCSAIRRVVEGATSTAELEAAYAVNKRTMGRLSAELPDLRSDGNQHYATILSTLFQSRLKRFSISEKSDAGFNRLPQNASV